MKKSTHELIGTCYALACNSAVEYGVTKVAVKLLEAALPGEFGKFSKFAIKLGIGLIYESTIGEKVSANLLRCWNTGTKALDQIGVFDEEDHGEEICESESEEGEA